MTNSAAQSPSDAPSSSSAAVGTAPAVPLTAKQQLAYDLRMQGKSRAEAASLMGISKPVYSKTLQAAYKKLGISHRKKGDVSSRATEIKDPQKFAAVVDAATDPEAKLETIRKVFRDYNLPPIASEALLRRIRQKYFGVVEATRSLKSGEIVDALNHKIDLALRYMDDKTMSEASFRDLALGTAAMIEKRQLLRGEPTAIISDAERKKLHELLPLAIAEAQRRGLTVDGQVTGKTVEPA
jgi:DNA-binding CsgD family transcriptional regulator